MPQDRLTVGSVRRALCRAHQKSLIPQERARRVSLWPPTPVAEGRWMGAVSVKPRYSKACTHKSPSRVRFRANRTSSRHRRMTDFDPKRTSCRPVVLMHNHPGGDPTPSRADIEMTRVIVEIAKQFGIAIQGHIIVGKQGHASLKGLKLI